MEKRELGVAIVGCGTVGSATALLLTDGKNALKARSNVELVLRYVVDLDFTAAESSGIDSRLFCKNYADVLDDSSVDVVVELIGGLTVAKQTIVEALEARKHVVTANKALLAECGGELLRMARENGVTLSFEASCAGGIPIIRAITNGLIANEITALYGILNGTCNYILTEMTQSERAYQEVLREAQSAGYAEADPTLDVSGQDTAHKLAILASLAFGAQIVLEDIPVRGIDILEEIDVAYGQELGYVVKLLAIAKRHEGGRLSLCVRPAFITKEHPLAWVSGPFNAVSVYGDATGHTMYYGRGAGGSPTASAVVADLYSIATGVSQSVFSHFLWTDRAERVNLLPTQEVMSRYYLRVMCEDAPGVLAQIASRLGDNQISILSVLQKELPDGNHPEGGVPVVITTHRAKEGSLQRALRAIDSLAVVKSPTTCIEIVEEHPERL
jgi:homoserine dehydrogenase